MKKQQTGCGIIDETNGFEVSKIINNIIEMGMIRRNTQLNLN